MVGNPYLVFLATLCAMAASHHGWQLLLGFLGNPVSHGSLHHCWQISPCFLGNPMCHGSHHNGWQLKPDFLATLCAMVAYIIVGNSYLVFLATL